LNNVVDIKKVYQFLLYSSRRRLWTYDVILWLVKAKSPQSAVYTKLITTHIVRKFYSRHAFYGL